MEYKGVERRACIRFKIPGATVSYSQKKILSLKKKSNEEFCPLINISRGGVRFQGKKPLKVNSTIFMKISVPGERVPLSFEGKVRWLSSNTEQDTYQVGVQFNPYGEKRGQNYPGTMVKIIALEQKFSAQDKPESEKFEIDSR